MTVGELKEKLAAFPDDHFLVIQIDQCGPQAFSPLHKLEPGYSDPYMKDKPYYGGNFAPEDDPGEEYPGSNSVLLIQW